LDYGDKRKKERKKEKDNQKRQRKKRREDENPCEHFFRFGGKLLCQSLVHTAVQADRVRILDRPMIRAELNVTQLCQGIVLKLCN
jgi:hypothetical protein